MSVTYLRTNPVRGINDLLKQINMMTKGGVGYVFHPHDQQLIIKKFNLKLHFKSVDSCIKKSSGILKLINDLSRPDVA